MKFDIHSHGFPLTTALENHVRRRLLYVLTRHRDSIDSIAIDLRSGFGAAPGFESSCSIRAELIDRLLPAITEHGADIYIVSDRGVDRIGRLITQALNLWQFDLRPRYADAVIADRDPPMARL